MIDDLKNSSYSNNYDDNDDLCYKSNTTEYNDDKHCTIVTSKDIVSVLQNQIGIGPVIISTLITSAKDNLSLQASCELSKCVTIMPTEHDDDLNMNDYVSMNNKRQQQPLLWDGYNVVFTGSTPGHARNQMHTMAKKILGIKVTSITMSRTKTNLVIVGNKPGNKTFNCAMNATCL